MPPTSQPSLIANSGLARPPLHALGHNTGNYAFCSKLLSIHYAPPVKPTSKSPNTQELIESSPITYQHNKLVTNHNHHDVLAHDARKHHNESTPLVTGHVKCSHLDQMLSPRAYHPEHQASMPKRSYHPPPLPSTAAQLDPPLLQPP